MSDPTPNSEFQAQVQRLVAEGKLTPEEAAGLLEGVAEEESHAAPEPVAIGDTPPDLRLEVSGYTLQVVVDGSVAAPVLHASAEGRVRLEATPQGWRVSRVPGHREQWGQGVRAILTVPFAPRAVDAEVSGGNLTVPDIAGEMHARVSGGNVTMGRAASLHASINGGNLTGAEMGGPTHLRVNGGNIRLEGARSLNASVNGGNLHWAGLLTGGDHRLEVNGGQARLALHPGSSVRVEAEVTVGGFAADFPLTKHGGLINARHSGVLGSGDALLSCRVAAGQVRLAGA